MPFTTNLNLKLLSSRRNLKSKIVTAVDSAQTKMSVILKAQQIVNLEPTISPETLRSRLIELGCAKSSTNRVVRRFKTHSNIVDKRLYNCGVRKLTPSQRQVLSRQFNNSFNISERQAARKMKVSQSTICRTLKRDLGIVFKKR